MQYRRVTFIVLIKNEIAKNEFSFVIAMTCMDFVINWHWTGVIHDCSMQSNENKPDVENIGVQKRKYIICQ